MRVSDGLRAGKKPSSSIVVPSRVSLCCHHHLYVLDAVGSSGISKGKQKLGVTFNFDKQDVIDFTKFSKMTMCRASEANS